MAAYIPTCLKCHFVFSPVLPVGVLLTLGNGNDRWTEIIAMTCSEVGAGFPVTLLFP